MGLWPIIGLTASHHCHPPVDDAHHVPTTGVKDWESGPHHVGGGDIQVCDLVISLCPVIDKYHQPIAISDLIRITVDRDPQDQVA